MRTAMHWKTNVRKKEMSAEISPSFNAVKKDAPQMEKPDSKKENEKIVKACTVISMSVLS